ncbi:MAG: hypothetical protein AB1632_06580 [Nitrospirota bacterium]
MKWKKIVTAGEKPGKGLYICTKCGKSAGIDNDAHTLPPCPQCKGSEYAAVSNIR